MAIKRVLFSIYQLVVFFFVFFCFYDTAGMNPYALSAAVNGENPLHVVTLTRITRDSGGNIVPDKYLPISAAEAITIFAVASAFCGANEKPDKIRMMIDTAYRFDNEQFELIEKRFGKLDRQAFISELLRQELESVDGLPKPLIEKIVLNKDAVIFKAFLSKQEDNSELEVNVDKISFNDRKNSVSNGISGDKFIPELATSLFQN